MASTIGIKIANGEFYPIMEENSAIRKRLILTTVHDNQPSVQIDLFRSASSVMTDAQYIGSLVVENIKPKLKGEPSIEMVISSNGDGEIVADALDLDVSSGAEHYVLTVSLKSLDERDMELPDFELESNEEPPMGLYQHASNIRKQEKRSSGGKMWIFVLIGLIIILGLAAAWLFLFDGFEVISSYRKAIFAEKTWQSEPEPVRQVEPVRQPEPEPVRQPEPEPVRQVEPVRQPEPEPVRQVEPVRQPEPEPVRQVEPVRQPEPEPVRQPEVARPPDPPPVIQAPATPPPPRPQPIARRRPPAPVSSYNVPATIPREGVDYRIRWGDTLWDISEAFYRDPWLYPRIARHNNIRNPDLIISGRIIRIPPRS